MNNHRTRILFGTLLLALLLFAGCTCKTNVTPNGGTTSSPTAATTTAPAGTSGNQNTAEPSVIPTASASNDANESPGSGGSSGTNP